MLFETMRVVPDSPVFARTTVAPCKQQHALAQQRVDPPGLDSEFSGLHDPCLEKRRGKGWRLLDGDIRYGVMECMGGGIHTLLRHFVFLLFTATKQPMYAVRMSICHM